MTPATGHSVSVAGAVVDDAGRVLAIRRRDNGRWEPPGGILELGEILHDGLRREVFEETGLKVEPDALTGIYQNLPRNIVAFVFRCHAVGGQLGPSAEASEVAWLTPTKSPTAWTRPTPSASSMPLGITARSLSFANTTACT